ncbi:MAG: diguanylate cyclase [Gammaproteobacteria bacterium]|nr:diguanylate cyclase [Gammaproteobacteria bacterium]
MAENRALRASLEAARERKAAHRLASYQARHDPVTGLPNRALFDERLEAAIAEAPRSGRGLALMFLDLDGFKAVNDSLGHDLGDRLLKAVAGRMQGCIRLSDTLARYGGDEFALLLPGVRARQDAAAIAGKILGCLGKPFQLAGRRLGVGVSIGIALYPEAGDVGEDLIRRADVAMYHVKGKEKNAFLFFSEEMDSEEMDPDRSGHLVTDRELHAGLIRGELELRYRPRVNLATGRITTLEAGWRWRHPERGLIGPGDTVAPERPGGAMAAVDSFLHRQAFEQTAEWRRRGTPDLGVAVALPAGRLAQPGFIDGFMENLRAADLDAAAATVEIDEAALMEPVQAIAAELADLRRRGVRVAASGFGAGFSSLRYLERLALHGLNLAPALMRDVRPGAGSGERTIAAIAAAAAALGLELFASGVETRDQLALLKSCGFSEAGGSVFSGAVPGSDIGRLLTGNPFASVVGV